ncbi:hypothetical protein E8K88_01440 [Lampropedia aestuarii]|uniref:Morphogenetic protein n=1 Tax=Lampropedia aestuarii TaxID=2562762 RepID=A0A4S5BXG1_9BURK|nr:hypothetical protein [Lampropedia aestuarii]THJ35971.1 hypothetical protein E8K88_01440 [Lampropedia aestuarii]
MKETGLMFKAPLVRAILSGQKTQTRRIVKPQPSAGKSFQGWVISSSGGKHDGKAVWGAGSGHFISESERARCPYGKPGDRIYVRETWCRQVDEDGFLLDAYWYRASTPDVVNSEDGEKSPWRPSIHMPKHVARIWLEITGVRVERLQDISHDDAMAEGMAWDDAIHDFQKTWESTGGDWDANPWVWVIDFKRIEKP